MKFFMGIVILRKVREEDGTGFWIFIINWRKYVVDIF